MSRILFVLILITACGVNSPFEDSKGAPIMLAPGIISTAANHESVSYISKDLKTVIFTRADQQWETSLIYKSIWNGVSWSEPKLLSFSGKEYDAGFCLSPEGNRAFFTSKRDPNDSTLSSEWNIWTVELLNEKWQNPAPLASPVNSLGSECCLTMNPKGETFFSSDRDGTWDIYRAKFEDDQFSEVIKLDTTVNSSHGEWPSFVSPNGTTLLFSSIRKAGIGGDDIYLTEISDGSWKSPLLLPKINSTTYEDSPMLSADGKWLLYSSRAESDFSRGVSNIYLIDSKAVIDD